MSEVNAIFLNQLCHKLVEKQILTHEDITDMFAETLKLAFPEKSMRDAVLKGIVERRVTDKKGNLPLKEKGGK